MNRKRIYRLYQEEGLKLRTKRKKKMVSVARVPLASSGIKKNREELLRFFYTDLVQKMGEGQAQNPNIIYGLVLWGGTT